MVKTPEEPVKNDNVLNIGHEDEEETRKLGSVVSDLIQFPSSEITGTPAGPSIHLYLPDHSEPITINNIARVTLGRVDSYSQQYPAIDLSDHHAKLLGVSRIHAEIFYDNGHYYIRDLESTNGTWVNNEKLAADDVVRLLNGDTIRLGHLMVQVGGVGKV